MHPHATTRTGFTLVELLMTLAIGAIVLMLAAPSLGNLLASTRMATAEGAIADSLNHARTEAIMHNGRVLVCPSIDARHCLPSHEWQHGWLIADDADGDGQPDGDVPTIAMLPALPAGTRVITSTGRRRVSFHPNGSAAGTNARFTVCHARQHDGKAVVVSNAGRVRIEAPDPEHLQACLAGIPRP